MWESICLTIAATAGNNIGKVLQKKGTLILPPLSFKLKVLRAYASNKAWIIGFFMDIFGAMLMLVALSQAPVSVIQPVCGCGLAILSVFSHFYLEEVMNDIDWIGIAFAGIGTIGVGAGGEQKASPISVFQLPWLASVVALLFYVHYLQRKYSLSSFNLLGHTAPAQAASLLLLGPFLDYCLTNTRIDAFEFNLPSTVFLTLSCTIAVGTNLSQFICIGRFTAVSFQVLGHMKTILVLILGFLFFGKEGLSIQVVIGMVIAVVGMMWYGNASSKPGGKERRSHSISRSSQQKHGSESSDVDDKV